MSTYRIRLENLIKDPDRVEPHRMADTCLGSFGSSNSKYYSEESERGRYEINPHVEVPLTVSRQRMPSPWTVGESYSEMRGLRRFMANHPADHEFYCGAGVIKWFLLSPRDQKKKTTLRIDVTIDYKTIPGRKLFAISFAPEKKSNKKKQSLLDGSSAAGHRFEQLMKRKINPDDPLDTCMNVFQRMFRSGPTLTWQSRENTSFTVDGRREPIEIELNKKSVFENIDDILVQCFVGNIDFILAGTVDERDMEMEIEDINVIEVATLKSIFNPNRGLQLLEKFLFYVKKKFVNVVGGRYRFMIEKKGENQLRIEFSDKRQEYEIEGFSNLVKNYIQEFEYEKYREDQNQNCLQENINDLAERYNKETKNENYKPNKKVNQKKISSNQLMKLYQEMN